MIPDELIKILRAQPFESFEVHMNSGTVFRVNHPDQAMVVPEGETLYLVANGKVERLACINISSISTDAVA